MQVAVKKGLVGLTHKSIDTHTHITDISRTHYLLLCKYSWFKYLEAAKSIASDFTPGRIYGRIVKDRIFLQ